MAKRSYTYPGCVTGGVQFPNTGHVCGRFRSQGVVIIFDNGTFVRCHRSERKGLREKTTGNGT